MLRRLWQLPTTFAWRVAILFASKSSHWNIVVCDVTSTQSYRRRFTADVRAVLDELATMSPKALQHAQQHVRYIARAQIHSRFEYFSSSKLLLLRVDYESGDVNHRK